MDLLNENRNINDNDNDKIEEIIDEDVNVLDFINSHNVSDEVYKDNKNKQDIIVGIDLGTTNSCICYWNNSSLVMIPDEKGNKTIPSYVAFTNVSRYIGYDAKNQSILNTNNVYYETKRLIGRNYTDPDVQKEKSLVAYKIYGDEQDNVRLISTLHGDKSFSPEEIASNILIKLKHMANEYLKTKITKAVITIPARFNDKQRQATIDAAKIAGLECVRIIHEPTAAAMAYGLGSRKLKKDEYINIIVYDFGGGTLDVSLVEISANENNENIFTVLGSAGNTNLGGSDFDKKICKYSMDMFKRKNKLKSLENLPALSLQRLKQSCENAKKILSTKNKTYIAVKEFYNDIDLLIPITREDFETICSDLFILSLKPIEDVLDLCEMTTNDIDEIIMVGGMTRMPMIMKKLEQRFKIKPNNSLNPDEAIAAGAAIQAYILNHNENPFSESMRLLDICPLSMGVETIGGIMDVLIPHGTIIPITIEKMYTTYEDYAESVLIKIYEGERQITRDNFFVGEFELKNIPKEPRGIPEIKVNFNLDENGILKVTAEELHSHEISSIIVNSNKSGLSVLEIENLINESIELEVRDEIERVRKQKHYQIDDFCGNITINIQNKNFKLSIHDKEIIEKDVVNILEWLKDKKYYDRTEEELETVLENLKKKYGVLILRGTLDDEDQNKIQAQKAQNNTTNIYDDDLDEDTTREEIIKNSEMEEYGFIGLSDPEQSELKELRKSLNELCYSIFGLLENSELKIKEEHKSELRDFIDDSLLWICSHEKPTKIDYKQKIDEVNEACDKILKVYDDENIFNNTNELINPSNKKEELENLCYTIKIMLNEKSIPVTTDDSIIIMNLIESNLEKIYSDIILSEEESEKLLNELNELCNNAYNKINGINIDTNIFNNNEKDEKDEKNDETNEGTSIDFLLKRRQQDEIEQLIIDNTVDNNIENNIENNINIDDVLKEYQNLS
jgi:molecular chaperone DnaK (HSP70)